jgi:hypothetical protein
MFQNPWAWLGLAAIAAPVLVHLLARRPARRIPFPTLRFLPATRLAPIRRGRLTDAGLLVVRCGVIAAAVAALAQPDWRRPPSAPVPATDLARAILVDASWSMSREAVTGGAALDAARREAVDLRAGATRARLIEARALVGALGGAAAWLAQQPMRRELVLVSDFQEGTIEREDLRAVPDDIGIRLVPIDGRAPRAPEPPDASSAPAIQLLAGAATQAGARAARRAAEARGAPARGRPDRSVAIVFPDFERRGELLGAARPLDEPWMFDIVGAVTHGDQAHTYLEGLTWSAGDAGRHELRLFSAVPAGTLGSAALIAAAARAASPDPDPAELAAATIADATLRAWERPASDVIPVAARDPDRSDGRWMWGLALALLALEAWLRRARPTPAPADEMPHERAA